jgi:hypothetical protein
MGLDTNSGSDKTYLSISEGRIAKRVEKGTEGAVECRSKDGSRIWYEKRYPSVTGRIVDVFKRSSDKGYGPQLCIVLEDIGEKFQVQMPWSSRYSSGFFLCMPNIDLSKSITLAPWMKEIDGQKKTMLYIRQGENNVDWYWTKDDPKGMPQMVQVKVKGEIVWDDTDRQQFFEDYLSKVFIPKMEATVIGKTEKQAEPATDSQHEDDLPF